MRIVELIDVMPTILQTVGVQMPEGTIATILPIDVPIDEENFAVSEMGEAITFLRPTPSSSERTPCHISQVRGQDGSKLKNADWT